jgi:hypothetical protein
MNEPDQRGQFDGDVVLTFLPDGRYLKLLRSFGYIDSQHERWDVPDGAIVDGASIPQVLWTLMGGPFEGKYRDASIVPDWYCDLRTRPWRNVHRVFYEAMLRSKTRARSRQRMHPDWTMMGCLTMRRQSPKMRWAREKRVAGITHGCRNHARPLKR